MPQTTIRAVFFDFDGVLTTDKTGSLTTIRYLSEQTGIEYARLRDAVKNFNDDLNLGTTTHDDIWPELCRALNRDIDKALLPRAFESTPMNAGMMHLARMLKANYCVGIITDNKKDRIDYLKVHAGLASLFDPIVVSAEVGVSKEHPRIFEHALSRLGIAPDESVFIDNTPDNLVAPSALGMHTIHFDDERNDLDALTAMLRQTYGIRLTDIAPQGSRRPRP